MKTYIFILIQLLITTSCFSNSSPLNGEELEQGKIYTGGTKISSEKFAISFTLPADWRGTWPEGSEFFIAEVSAPKGNIFIHTQFITEKQLHSHMGQPVHLDDNTRLFPESTPVKNGDWLTANYKVPSFPNLAGHIEGKMFDASTAVAVLALTDETDRPAMIKVLQKFSGTFKRLPFDRPAKTKSQ